MKFKGLDFSPENQSPVSEEDANSFQEDVQAQTIKSQHLRPPLLKIKGVRMSRPLISQKNRFSMSLRRSLTKSLVEDASEDFTNIEEQITSFLVH